MSENPPPPDATPAQRLAWVRQRRGYKTAKEFSDKLGIPQPTYHQYEAGKRKMPPHVAASYAKALGVTGAWLLWNEGPMEPNWPERLGPPTATVIGEVQAGVFREALEWPVDKRFEVMAPPDARYPGVTRFALLVRGNSMNREFPEGTILICVPFYPLKRLPLTGDYVICTRRATTGEMEATVKQYEHDPQGRHILWPRSTDPEHQQPIVLPTLDMADGIDGAFPSIVEADAVHHAVPPDMEITALVTSYIKQV